jgi:hypothetical protein
MSAQHPNQFLEGMEPKALVECRTTARLPIRKVGRISDWIGVGSGRRPAIPVRTALDSSQPVRKGHLHVPDGRPDQQFA